jgi:serine/threonine protein kinase/Tol biopolymer transport system component
MNKERWQKVRRICEDVLEREAGERQAFLTKACAGDEGIREEVESFLSGGSGKDGFIETPVLEIAAKAMARNEAHRRETDLTGRTVLHYRITEKIGAGGMGEVYRAKDTKLGRQVAVKVLPDIFTDDPERLARLEREARLLASLNHPNIAAIYGIEEAAAGRFLVLEFVEGETLAQRIARGPWRMDEALEACRQIAEGLEAAHEKGIIHRDLKPANMKITPEGKVKILDFGLAKAFHQEAAAADIAQSPAISEAATGAGVVLGTAAYMSPEQARGKPVDKRTDIWAFGCVLYECLTGRKAFQGDTITEIIASILKSEPDWTLLPVDTSPFTSGVLRQCLQKDPNLRLHDIADARVEMLECFSKPAEGIPAGQRFPLGWFLSISTATLVTGLLIGVFAMKYLRSVPSASVVRSIIRVEPGQGLAGLDSWQRRSPTAMAISRAGRFIVYSAIADPGPQAKPKLFLRSIDQKEAKPIPGTDGGQIPFLSPDEKWLGFWAGGKLLKVPIEGGVPVPLCDARASYGVTWGIDDNIVFSPGQAGGLYRVAADGGKPELLTTPDKTKEEDSHRLPFCLPNGKGILFTIMRDWRDMQPRIAVLELETRRWRYLQEDAADARYVATGHLVFLRQGTLMAVPFDLDKLGITGKPVPVIVDIMQELNGGMNRAAGQFSVSDSGWLLYASGGIAPDMEGWMVWVDHKGASQAIASIKDGDSARISPDGRRIAYPMQLRMWIFDLERGIPYQMSHGGQAFSGIWTPDGNRVLFDWYNNFGRGNLWWQPVDANLPMERLTTSEMRQFPGSWSPDGTTLAFVEQRPGTGNDVLLLDLRNGRRVTPFLNSRFDEWYPEISPDGRWMAYCSNESGQMQVYVTSFPDKGNKWWVSNEGSTEPIWARNGKQLFYRQADKVWAVDIQSTGSFSAGKPRLLFEQPGYLRTFPNRSWDISPDGTRFLMVKRQEQKPQPVTQMILVQNWFEELKRLVPTGRQ